jgi:hypothetical protein
VREFLYLNESLVDQFLAQAEDGLYDEVAERERSVGGRKAGGSIGGYGARAEAGVSRDRESELSRVRRQTPESRFNRLAHLAEQLSESEYVEVSAADDHIYPVLTAGRLLAAECYVDVPSVGRVLAQPEQVEALFDVMKSFAADQLSDQDQTAMAGIAKLAGSMGGAIVGTGEIRESAPTLIFKLQKQYLRVDDLGDLEGDAVVFGRVARRWPEGESYPILAVPGLNMMSRGERRRMGEAPDDSDMTVPGPGATISVVAIYRV